jgi:hypothetical protein
VDAGSGPERDDFGLPPVDIEIPDDARELDEDVHSYHRELRALRRKRRSDRLRRPLTRPGHWPGREGITVPLLACCLMLALITSTLLVMFAADQTGVPQSAGTGHAAVSHPAAAPRRATGKVGQPLPSALVIVGGSFESLRAVTADRPSMLALVPQGCGCAAAVRQLGAAADSAHVHLYLVGTPATMTQLVPLAAQAGQSTGQVADDTARVLATVYRQQGLTALLVRAGGTVTYIARDLAPPQGLGTLRAKLQQLSPAGTSR